MKCSNRSLEPFLTHVLRGRNSSRPRGNHLEGYPRPGSCYSQSSIQFICLAVQETQIKWIVWQLNAKTTSALFDCQSSIRLVWLFKKHGCSIKRLVWVLLLSDYVSERTPSNANDYIYVYICLWGLKSGSGINLISYLFVRLINRYNWLLHYFDYVK